MIGRGTPPALLAAVLAASALAWGCGGDSPDSAPDQPRDRPARAPAGWRTVTNRAAGFTIAAPRSWPASARGRATQLRSDDRLVAISVSADRSRQGRSTPAADYARQTLAQLPDFEGSELPEVGKVRGSPYRSALVEAVGRVRTSPRRQRISVAVFQRPGAVTYAAVVFRNANVLPRVNDARVARVLGTLRAQPPGA